MNVHFTPKLIQTVEVGLVQSFHPLMCGTHVLAAIGILSVL
jgi:hypothetical protein